MDCWHCRRTAVGACRFCGRGICEDHVETQPYILELFRSKDVKKSKTELVVIVTPEVIAPYNPSDAKPMPEFSITPLPDSAPAMRELTKAVRKP